MIARFLRTLSKAQHRISLILIMNQDQQPVGRQRYIRREAFRSNLFGREILPTDEKLHAAFFHLRNRFQVWIARAKPRCNRDSLTTRVRKTRPSNTSKPNYFRFSQRFPTSGGAEINDGED